MISGVTDRLFISVDRESNDEIQVANKKIFLDTSYNRNLHVRIFGTVESTPRALQIFESNGKFKGTRPYADSDPQIGEKVYFHFHTVSNYNKFTTNEGKVLYILNYPQIFCFVRDGKIHMVNDRILVTPVHEKWETCFTAGTQLKLKEGKTEAKTPEDFDVIGFGLQTKTFPDPIKQVGIIRHCGNYDEIKPGDSVLFSKDSEFENRIENENFFVMRSDDILAHYDPFEDSISEVRPISL